MLLKKPIKYQLIRFEKQIQKNRLLHHLEDNSLVTSDFTLKETITNVTPPYLRG